MKNTPHSNWPKDADGDVFRRLEASGFNFELAHNIDFNIDFETWPPSPDFINTLQNQYPNVEMFEPDNSGSGYVLFVIKSKLTYELVMFIQHSVTELAAPYGGVCESWGVLQK